MRQRDAASVLHGKPFRPADNSPSRRHFATHRDLLCLIVSIICPLRIKGKGHGGNNRKGAAPSKIVKKEINVDNDVGKR